MNFESAADPLGKAKIVTTLLRRLRSLVAKLDPTRRRRAAFRAAWGEPGSKDGWLASRWFDLARKVNDAKWVDDKTWADLEFPRLFTVLYTTVSPIGAQYLYRELRRYEPDSQTLSQKFKASVVLRDRQDLREELQLILTALEADSTAEVVDVLIGPPLRKLKHHGLLSLWSAICLAALTSSLLLSLTLWVWAPILAVNGWIILFASPQLDLDAESIVRCGRLLRVANRIGDLDDGADIPEVRSLAGNRKRHARLRRQTGFLGIMPSPLPDFLVDYLLLALNVCFLAKMLAFAHTVERFNRSRADWISTLESIGAIDALIAAANALHRYPKHCHPTMTDDAMIAITDGYHALLERPVVNSCMLHAVSAVISGSNMTGKTAFIKMIATNIVLGRTVGFCLAASATIPRSSVMTSIQSEHSLEFGKSKYFAEIDAILRFIESAARGECRVFVIDELFSGTNTVERIAAAKAVLEALCNRAQVIATTHDVELQYLMSPRYVHFHFREDPAVDGYFDYKLRPGASRAQNAIRLLERMGFPPEIVRNALALAQNHPSDDRLPARLRSI